MRPFLEEIKKGACEAPFCLYERSGLFGNVVRVVERTRHGNENFVFVVLFNGGEVVGGHHVEAVDFVLDIVAELERGDEAFLDEDCFARAGVPCRACLARLAGEGAEPADFDGVPVDQFFADKLEELFDDGFDVAPNESGGFGNFLYKTLFRYVRHDIKYRYAIKKNDVADKN